VAVSKRCEAGPQSSPLLTFNFPVRNSFPSTERQRLRWHNPMNVSIVLPLTRDAALKKWEQGYRAQVLRLFPWVCGRCARTFDHANLQLLEVHHKNNNHHDNPFDGSNWEVLCTYCHENEHSKLKDMEGRSDSGNVIPNSTFNSFADLKTMLASRK
jgi:5-methylcytosine-specific restriction endonuclease McrA